MANKGSPANPSSTQSPAPPHAEKVKFRFKTLDTIGSADAHEDIDILKQCFVDNGTTTALADFDNPRRIIIGFTGAGKSAALSMLRENNTKNTIEIQPESLALAHISNSTIIRHLSEIGIDFDLFFKLLWRHVFTVEVLKHHFQTERAETNIWERLRSRFGDRRSHEQALQYLETWGSAFWKETDYRVKETTSKLENEVEATIGHELAAKVRAKSALTEEQRVEVTHRAQEAINKIQIKELSKIMDLLDEVLNQTQSKYYITIDKLDERWVEDGLRYRLIRALIETTKDFRKVRNLKICIALRHDLIDRVFRLTRDAGFQEEKYESLYLPIKWTDSQLIEMLNRRIGFLAKRSVLAQKLGHSDILPKTIDGDTGIQYVLDRTLKRPRDAIHFLNSCIEAFSGRSQFTPSDVRQAEAQYSRLRLRALADEWFGDYPELFHLVEVLKNMPDRFSLQDLQSQTLVQVCLDLSTSSAPHGPSLLREPLMRVAEARESLETFILTLAVAFYTTGIIGLKLESYEELSWAHSGRRTISSSEIDLSTKAMVHKAFWRSLGIRSGTSRAPTVRR